MSERKGPVLIELDDGAVAAPQDATPVPDLTQAPEGRAMQMAATLAARRPNRLSRLFWGALLALVALPRRWRRGNS